MRIRHMLWASLAVVVIGADAARAIDVFWGGGIGNFNDANWIDGGGVAVTPAAGDNVIINAGSVTIDSDKAGSVGNYGELRIGDGTLVVTTGGKVSFGGNVLLGATNDTVATLIMEGDSVFSGRSFQWGFAAGSQGNVTIRDTATFRTIEAQDIIGFSSAVGAGTWTTVGSGVTIVSDDDIWIGDNDVWIANITDPDSFSTAIAEDAFGFVGPSAVEVNLSGFTLQPGQKWRLLEGRGETPQGPINNGFLPARFTVNGLPAGYGMDIRSEEVSDTLGYLEVELINVLNLKVDASTGEAYLENPAAGGLPLDVDGYTITSDSGALVSGSFNGLADDGQAGWFAGQAPSQGANRVSEANFVSSTVFQGPGAGADFNGDGSVGGADYLAWQANFGTTAGATRAQGDADGDGAVDADDLAQWEADFGSSGGGGSSFALGAIFNTAGAQDLALEFTLTDGRVLSGTVEYVSNAAVSAVPEPASAALLGLLSLVGLSACRNRR